MLTVTQQKREHPIIGVDIGGTKCAVSHLHGDEIREVTRIPTTGFEATFHALAAAIEALPHRDHPRFGISCGGPLDTTNGVILSPPNLASDWYGVPIVARLVERFGGTATLMNDANACALAEWRFGAGRGCRHMIFLTSGTGLGAGLILNGRLYEGATGDAGEIGHVRLSPDGPLGFGKHGSAEGFYSGGGITRLAERRVTTSGEKAPAWFTVPGPLTTKRIADAAKAGDPSALAVLHEAGGRLGEALAILIDLFNPERIVIGGFFPLCRELLEPAMIAALSREALPIPAKACAIFPAELGETIGSHGAIAAALHPPEV